MPLGLARVVHDGGAMTVVAARADIFLFAAASSRLDSDSLMTFGFRAVRISLPVSSASGTAGRHYPLDKFFRQLTFRANCRNAYLPNWPAILRSQLCNRNSAIGGFKMVLDQQPAVAYI